MASAAIAAASSGDNTIVTAVATKKIQVVRFLVIANGTVNAKWKSGASTDVSGLLYLVANSGVSAPGHGTDREFWLETAVGQGLVLNLSAAIAVGGILVYQLG